MSDSHTKTTSAKGAWVLGLLLGLGLGALEQSLGVFVIGALLGYLLVQVAHLQRVIARLLQDASSAGMTAPPPAPVPPSATTDGKPPDAGEPAPASPSPPPLPPPLPARDMATAQAAAQAAAPRTRTALGQWIDRGWAWLRGGNPLARAGIVILFFGAAFLARYAAEHTRLPIEFRFVFLGIGAMTLLAIGWWLRAKRRLYAHILQGGGVAGLYLTVFAATRLYQLLPQGLALGLMVVVAVVSAILAVGQASLPLAVIGTTGGFLAPILVSTGGGNHVALFTYYTVLNLGVFTVAWFRAWRVLNLVGFVFTFGIAGLFRATAYGPDKMHSTDAFLLLYFLMYVGISILFALRQKPNLRGYVSGSLVFGLPVAAFSLHATMVSHIPYAMAWSAVALGAFYLMASWSLLRSGRDTLRLLAEAFAALGVIFASLAIPLGFDTQTTAAMWAVEGAGLLWLGVRQMRTLARVFGLLLQLLAGGAYLVGATSMKTGTPILNTAYVGTLMIAVSGVFAAWWLYAARARLPARESWLSTALAFWSALWWLGGGTVEIDRAWPLQSLGAILALYAVSGVLLEQTGARLAWPMLRRVAVAVLFASAAIGLLQSVQLGHPSMRYGAIGWLLWLVATYRVLWRYDATPDMSLRALPALHAIACWLSVLLVAWEAHWQIRQYVAGAWPLLPWGLVPAAVLWLSTARAPRPAWPLEPHRATYRGLVAPALALFAAAWVLAVNVHSDGSAEGVRYLPLFNPLDLSIALVSAALLRYGMDLCGGAEPRATPSQKRVLIGAYAALNFLWLNGALLRALHHGLGTPLTAYGIAHSTVDQAALSIFWGLLGFASMVLSSRRGWRLVWIAGAVMMGIVVVKLFLVDTAGRGTLARIVSFLTVGILLLVTGYVSPLPPPRREDPPT